MLGVRCFLKISRNSGNVTEEAVVCRDERASGETSLDGDEHVMSVNGQDLILEIFQTKEFSPSTPGVGLRKNTPMKQMPLIEGEGVPVPHEFQGRLSRIPAVEEVSEIVCGVRQVYGFQQGTDGWSTLPKD